MNKRADPANALRNALRHELKTLADPTRAVQQQAYMKSAMPYLGLTAPELAQVLKTLLPAHPLQTEAAWQQTVLLLWREAAHREERYAAVALAEYRPYQVWLTPAAVPMLEEMVVSGAWWDFVDHLAARHFFQIRCTHRKEIHSLMRKWARNPDMWRRRVAILFQLKARADTDEALLFHTIEHSMAESEFFLRKAIGWALREYSKTRPDTVIDYVTRHRDALSNLSRREACKVLLKQGLIEGVP